eukprot:TRINITY_DN2630_c0_g3_i1.p1 TRINITY_DN2630_c0_g3~~TRINITY_DN2630_c0_g3_i1.p1  ORF type:complete len:650 (+),score=166.05 TRINITY_DN2630_c0_g3_i1:82-1950(+)
MPPHADPGQVDALAPLFPGVQRDDICDMVVLCGGAENAAAELLGMNAEQIARWLRLQRGAQQGAAHGAVGSPVALCQLFPGLAPEVAAAVIDRCGGDQGSAAEILATRTPHEIEQWLETAVPVGAPNDQPVAPSPPVPAPAEPATAEGRLMQLFSGVPPEWVSQVFERCDGCFRRSAEVLASETDAGTLEDWLRSTAPVSPISALIEATGWPDTEEVRRVLDLCGGDSAGAFHVLSRGPGHVQNLFHSKRTLECPVCLSEETADVMYCIGCDNLDHCMCHECALNLARSSLRDKTRIRCPHQGCTYLLSDHDVRRMRWPREERSSLTKQHTEVLLQGAITALNCIACPTPGCGNWVELADPGRRQAIPCPACARRTPVPRTAVFCSRCREPHHYVVECADVPGVTGDWLHWCEQGRAEAHERWRAEGRAIEQEFEEQKRKTSERNAELRAAYEQLRKDEQWKEQHCKACPSCGVAIQRIEGCDNMICGSDRYAETGRQGHRAYLGGCGKHFIWQQAPQYVSKMPQLREKTGPQRRDRTETWADWGGVRCCGCNQPLKGPRFQCIHCPSSDYCHNCEQRFATHEHHRNHVFRILTDPRVLLGQAAPAGPAPQPAPGDDGGFQW